MDNEWQEILHENKKRVGPYALARALGVTVMMLRNWEKGKHTPHPENIKKILALGKLESDMLYSVTLSVDEIKLVVRALLDGRYLAKKACMSHENTDKALILIIKRACYGRKG